MTKPTLGMRIKRARERKRWSQQRLADELSVHVKTIDNWENDRSYPRSSIGALEHVLGVSPDDDESLPPAVSANWHDKTVRTLWESDLPEAERIDLVRDYLARKEKAILEAAPEAFRRLAGRQDRGDGTDG